LPEPLNLIELKHRLMDDDTLVRHIVASFRSDLDRQITNMRTAFESGDLNATALAAHSMKGSSANLSAKPLSNACSILEKAARSGATPAEISAAFAEVSRSAEHLRVALTTLSV
jgi:HPt (histidine-containing phosphotransfer) domain-containing protein